MACFAGRIGFRLRRDCAAWMHRGGQHPPNRLFSRKVCHDRRAATLNAVQKPDAKRDQKPDATGVATVPAADAPQYRDTNSIAETISGQTRFR